LIATDVNLNGVAPDQDHVVMGDIVTSAFRKMDGERLEVFGCQQLSDFGSVQQKTILSFLFQVRLRRLSSRDVLNTGNVENGTFDIFLGEKAGVQLDANLDGVLFDECHVVIGDLEGPAVRQGDAEGPERGFVHSLAQL
jgi:hypothetical protein